MPIFDRIKFIRMLQVTIIFQNDTNNLDVAKNV